MQQQLFIFIGSLALAGLFHSGSDGYVLASILAEKGLATFHMPVANNAK